MFLKPYNNGKYPIYEYSVPSIEIVQGVLLTNPKPMKMPYSPENISRAFFFSRQCQQDTVVKTHVDLFLIKSFIYYNYEYDSENVGYEQFRAFVEYNSDFLMKGFSSVPSNLELSDTKYAEELVACQVDTLKVQVDGVAQNQQHDTIYLYKILRDEHEALQKEYAELMGKYKSSAGALESIVAKNGDEWQRKIDEAITEKTSILETQMQEVSQQALAKITRLTEYLEGRDAQILLLKKQLE